MSLFLIGALAWGVHLSSVGIFYDIPDTEKFKIFTLHFSKAFYSNHVGHSRSLLYEISGYTR